MRERVWSSELDMREGSLFACSPAAWVGPRGPVLFSYTPLLFPYAIATKPLQFTARKKPCLFSLFAYAIDFVKGHAFRNSQRQGMKQIIRRSSGRQELCRAVYIVVDTRLCYTHHQARTRTPFVPLHPSQDVYPFASQLWPVGRSSGLCAPRCRLQVDLLQHQHFPQHFSLNFALHFSFYFSLFHPLLNPRFDPQLCNFCCHHHHHH